MKPHRQPDPSIELPLPVNVSLIVCLRAQILFRRLTSAQKKLSADNIHDLRVAARRFREALDVSEELLGADGSDKIARQARKLTRWPGQVRNLDVTDTILSRVIAENPQSPAAELATQCKKQLLIQRRSARKSIASKIRDFDGQSLEAKIGKLIQKWSQHPPALLSRAIIETVLKRRLRTAFALKRKALQPKNAEAQHRLRIAIKKLRYALEILLFAFGKNAQPFLEQLQSLQDLLGEIHDLDVLSQAIQQPPDDKKKKVENTVSSDLLRVLAQMRTQRQKIFAEAYAPLREKDLLSALMNESRV